MGGCFLEDVLDTAREAGYKLACFNDHIWAFDADTRWIQTPLMLEDLRCEDGR